MFGPSFGTPRAPRYRSLDHWRGVACILVVVYHSTSVWAASPTPETGAAIDTLTALVLQALRVFWIGVPIFFVISGYAISATVDGSRQRGEGVRPYFRRRLRRIYPPYWAWIVAQTAIVFAVDVVLSPGLLTTSAAPIERPWDFTAGQWAGNLTLTESWRATAFPWMVDRGYILGQAWTLCYEEQFYLVAGVLLAVAARRYFLGAILVTLFTLVMSTVGRQAGLPVLGFFFDGNWLMFAAGILVYWQVNYGSRRTLPGAYAVLGLGVLWAFRSFPYISNISQDLLVGLAFAAVILALHPFDARISTAHRLAPVRFLGMICYSLYLSHAVIVRTISQAMADAGVTGPTGTLVVVVPVCTAAAVVVGWLFFRGVERRFLNTRPTRRTEEVAAAPT